MDASAHTERRSGGINYVRVPNSFCTHNKTSKEKQIKIKLITSILITSAMALSLNAQAATNLIANGGFELGTLDTTTTPIGWTNVGHSDGVIPYAQFSTPAYEGSFFYDLGGFGNASGPVGDGIEQTVATAIGTSYTLTFGLSSEDVRGESTLQVQIGSSLFDFPLTSTGTFLGKGFTTQNLNYIATGTSTNIRFIETVNTSGGNNDPMIDGVIFSTVAVPEPETYAMLMAGLGVIGFIARRRKTS